MITHGWALSPKFEIPTVYIYGTALNTYACPSFFSHIHASPPRWPSSCTDELKVVCNVGGGAQGCSVLPQQPAGRCARLVGTLEKCQWPWTDAAPHHVWKARRWQGYAVCASRQKIRHSLAVGWGSPEAAYPGRVRSCCDALCKTLTSPLGHKSEGRRRTL